MTPEDFNKYNAIRINIKVSDHYQFSSGDDVADVKYDLSVQGILPATPGARSFQASGYLPIDISGYEMYKNEDRVDKTTYLQPADGKAAFVLYQDLSSEVAGDLCVKFAVAGGDRVGNTDEFYRFLEYRSQYKDLDTGKEFDEVMKVEPFHDGHESWTCIEIQLKDSPKVKGKLEYQGKDFHYYTPPNLIQIEYDLEFINTSNEVIINTVIDETYEAYECVKVVYSDSQGKVHECCTDAAGRFVVKLNKGDYITVLGIKKEEGIISGDLLAIKS